MYAKMCETTKIDTYLFAFTLLFSLILLILQVLMMREQPFHAGRLLLSSPEFEGVL